MTRAGRRKGVRTYRRIGVEARDEDAREPRQTNGGSVCDRGASRRRGAQVWDEDFLSADDMIGQRRLRLSDVDFALTDHGQGHEASVVFARDVGACASADGGAQGGRGGGGGSSSISSSSLELELSSAPAQELWVPLERAEKHWMVDELARCDG